MKRVFMRVKDSISKPGLLSVQGVGRNFRQELVNEGFKAEEDVVIISVEDYEMLLAGSGLGDKR